MTYKSEQQSSVGEWTSREISSFCPARETGLKALRHLSNKIRKDLFSENEHTKQNAVGLWYEALVYETLLERARESQSYVVIGKGNDVPVNVRRSSRLCQDGLYYDEGGAIVARGNGQDLAELDLMIANKHGEIAFGEIIKSEKNLKGFEAEINYKRQLLTAMFSQPAQFVLISCSKLRHSLLKKTLSAPNSHSATTGDLSELLSGLKPEDVSELSPRKAWFKPILLSDLKYRRINYLYEHNQCRDELTKSLAEGRMPHLQNNFSLVKRILVGCLNEQSTKWLLLEKNITVEGKRLNAENFAFSKVVLALSLPEFRPILYLRLPTKPIYLKMGPLTTSTFEFERNIYSWRTAFFAWLENVSFRIWPDLLGQILNRYLNESVVGSKKKHGESASFS